MSRTEKKIIQILKRCMPVAAMLLLLGTGVYAWIYGNVTPEMTGSFKIGSMSGLNFEIDSSKTNLVSLNEAYGIAADSLNLNEVSSADGRNFFARDTSQLYLESGNEDASDNREIITFRPAAADVVVETQDGEDVVRSVEGDYLDVSFRLLMDYNASDTASYYIYFLNGSLDNAVFSTSFRKGSGAAITAGGLKALRAALQVSGASGYGPVMQEDEEDSGTYTAIFGNNSELGTADAPYRTAAVAETESVQLKLTAQSASSAAEDIAGSYRIDYLSGISSWPHSFGVLDEAVNVHSFSSCSIDPAELDNVLSGEQIPNEQYLFRMDRDNHSAEITLRVWLEGGSESCVNGQIVPEDEVDLNLYFIAYCVE